MFLYKLLLQDFRLFSQQLVEFKQQVSLIVAPNAAGKTAVLEAIYLLASGQSYRAGKVEEMVGFAQELARVKAKVYPDVSSIEQSDQLGALDELQLEVIINRGKVNGRRTQKLLYSINENKRRKRDFVGKLLAVVFRPEDMRLIEGSPGRRREYLNSALLQTSREYGSTLTQYEKTLRRRNKLLSQIRDGEQKISTLTYWNMSLVKHGEQLQAERRELIEFINTQVDAPLPMQLRYLPSVMTQERLASHERAELAAGFTLIGPHKDDFEVLGDVISPETASSANLSKKTMSELVSLDAFGSRGQKRMGVLWLKKAELTYLKHRTQQLPLLLLDDILSELDEANRGRVLKLVDGEQIIITTTDEDLVKEVKEQFSRVQVIRLP